MNISYACIEVKAFLYIYQPITRHIKVLDMWYEEQEIIPSYHLFVFQVMYKFCLVMAFLKLLIIRLLKSCRLFHKKREHIIYFCRNESIKRKFYRIVSWRRFLVRTFFLFLFFSFVWAATYFQSFGVVSQEKSLQMVA